MQNNQIQEPVVEADGERLRPHAVSIYIWQLKKAQSEANFHHNTTMFWLQTVQKDTHQHNKLLKQAVKSYFKTIPACFKLFILPQFLIFGR